MPRDTLEAKSLMTEEGVEEGGLPSTAYEFWERQAGIKNILRAVYDICISYVMGRRMRFMLMMIMRTSSL